MFGVYQSKLDMVVEFAKLTEDFADVIDGDWFVFSCCVGGVRLGLIMFEVIGLIR